MPGEEAEQIQLGSNQQLGGWRVCVWGEPGVASTAVGMNINKQVCVKVHGGGG